jgi:serine/threonine protein kinase
MRNWSKNISRRLWWNKSKNLLETVSELYIIIIISLTIIYHDYRKTLSILEFLHIAIQIVQGLKAIHEMGIIHKDINPSNILINPNSKQVK